MPTINSHLLIACYKYIYGVAWAICGCFGYCFFVLCFD